MAEKQLFGVFAPVLGEKKNFPTILLDKTIQAENSNILRKYGEIHRRKMRKSDMISKDIDVGSACTDRAGGYSGDKTFIDLANPANISGKITNVSIWVYSDDVTSAKVAIFYAVDATHYTSRSVSGDLGVITSGTIRNFEVDLDIEAGDFIGLYFTGAGGAIQRSASGGSGVYYKAGDYTGCENAEFTLYSDCAISLYGTGNGGGSGKTLTPDGNPILHYHTFIKRSTAMQYFLAFTKAHIYCWNPSTSVWDLKFTCQSDCTEWDTVSYNDKVIATNNVDKVLVWDTTGNFVALDDTTNGIEYETGKYLTKAKYVTTFENYLILGYVTMDSVLYPQREVWNCIADETDWKSAGSGVKETDGEDRIVGFKIYDGQLIIFKEKTRIVQVLVPTSEMWNWTILPGNIGCLSNHSIVEDADGRVYWLANDFTIREMGEGEISQEIDPIIKLIEPSSTHLVYGIFIKETGEVWWSIPYDNALPNKVITVKGLGNWGELNLAVSAFGSYKES